MTTTQHEVLSVTIDGEEITDLYDDLSLEVELDDELAALCRITLPMDLQADGTWSHLEDGRLQVWKAVVIKVGFGDSAGEELLDGFITHVRPTFQPDSHQSRLEIWGMDRSVLMDREEKLKDWPNKKDSDIAREIFQSYGLTAEVTETDVLHDEAVSTTIQRETDIQFLRRLALRNGFECFIEGTRGLFRLPDLEAAPQPLLAAHFGDETTLLSFWLEVNALTPAHVSMVQIDRTSKDVLRSDTTSSAQRALGAAAPASLLGPGMTPGQVFVSRTAAASLPEMSALGQSLFHRGEWFVTGSGEIAGNTYGHVLRPRATVTIKGLGETHSGIYYVGHVTHRFSQDGYVQAFDVKRNGLRPTGDEDFGGAGAGLGGLL